MCRAVQPGVAVPVLAFLLPGLGLGIGIGIVAGWLARGRPPARLRRAGRPPTWTPPQDQLELAEQRRVLIEACRAGAARIRFVDPELWERMTDALTAAGVSPYDGSS